MAEQPFEDNDPTVYSSHVLYVKKNDPHCTAVTTRIDATPLGQEVFVQDVMSLTQRPGWLRGVPTLFVRNGDILTGVRDIVNYASTWRNTEPGFVSSSITSTSSSSLGGGNLFDSSMFSIEGDPTSTSVPTLPSEGRGGQQMGERAQRKAAMAAATNNAVEQLQNARAAMDRNMYASMQRSNVPPPRNMMMADQEVQAPLMRRRGWN
jgi:hypothetical protein